MSAATAAEAVREIATPARRPLVPQWWRDSSGSALWVLLIGVVAVWVHGGGWSELLGARPGDRAATGGAMLALSDLVGLVASALLLTQVALMARVPWIEQAWGQDELTRSHRRIGLISFVMLVEHIALVVLAQAVLTSSGVWHTTLEIVLDDPGMLLAAAGTLALCLVVVTSLAAARARMRHEAWHLIHLYAYLGAGLALPHQLWTGTDFVGSSVATVSWWGTYALVMLAVVIWRVIVPLHRSLRARIEVEAVTPAGPGATHVIVGGPGVALLRPRGGQFFQWRFLDGPGWSRAHPYSLSAAPDGRTLRLTAAHVGDGSTALAALRPGARVLLEGPYGRLHDGVRRRPKVLLVAGGIGIAPLRALLEDLPTRPGDVTVIHRVSTLADPLVAETRALAERRGDRYVTLPGRRHEAIESWLPAEHAHRGEVAGLSQIVPDIAEREVYLCGAPAWMGRVTRAARAAGVPGENLHTERFDL